MTGINPDGTCWQLTGSTAGAERTCPLLAAAGHCRNCEVYGRAGRALLNRPLPDDYVEEQTRRLAQDEAREERLPLSAFVFRTGSEWLALRADIFREIVPMAPIHTIPRHESKVLKGLVNVRGRLELCFSLGFLLGIEKDPAAGRRPRYVSPERLVVIAFEGNRLVFPVTEVLGMIRYGAAMMQQPPVTLSRARAAHTSGILTIGPRNIGLLDEKLLGERILRSLS